MEIVTQKLNKPESDIVVFISACFRRMEKAYDNSTREYSSQSFIGSHITVGFNLKN